MEISLLNALNTPEITAEQGLAIKLKLDQLQAIKDAKEKEPEKSENDDAGIGGSGSGGNFGNNIDGAANGIESLQKDLKSSIEDALKSNKIFAVDKNGNKINGFTLPEEGTPRSEDMIGFCGKDAEEIARKTKLLYERFSKMGFETIISEKSGTKGNNYFFGIIFPDNYHDNSDPLTMSPEQIKDASSCLQKPNTTINVNSERKPSSIRMEAITQGGPAELKSFYDDESKNWKKALGEKHSVEAARLQGEMAFQQT